MTKTQVVGILEMLAASCKVAHFDNALSDEDRQMLREYGIAIEMNNEGQKD